MEIALVILVLAGIFIVRSIKVVPQQNAWVVERLGKYLGTLTPGLNFLIPFIDRVAYKHSLKEIPLDVRVIAASNRDLKKESAEGNFRLDLYYRLSVIQIDIPPLRARGDDVLLLANYYIEKTNAKRRGSKKLRGLAAPTAKIFSRYEWTGNVRELKNVIERASILEDGEQVTTEHLPFDLTGGKSASPNSNGKSSFTLPSDGIPLIEVELDLSRQALERTGGNLTRAARLLHISRDQLRYRLNKPKEDKDLKAKTRIEKKNVLLN